MRNHNLVLTYPILNTEKIRRSFPEDSKVYWAYFGSSFSRKRSIEQKLKDPFKYIDISKQLNVVAFDVRKDYVKWIDGLNRRYGADLEWWFGSISSRNVYNSDLFQNLCYLEILKRLWTAQETFPELIFIESFGLAKAIKKWALEKDITIEINYGSFFWRKYNSRFLFFINWAKFAIMTFSAWLAALITKFVIKGQDIKVASPIIISTFVHDYCLARNGKLTDRYFPYLHEYLTSQNVKIIVHPILAGFYCNYFSVYGRARKSDSCLIVKEDFLKFHDYMLALTYPLRMLARKINAEPLRTFDFSDIIEEERGNLSFSQGMQAILVYRSFLMFKKTGVKPRLMIIWYENQVIDKAAIAGARKAFSDIKIIGAQTFLFPANRLNLFPSQSEVEAQLVPDLLLETSEYECRVAQSFTKDIRCSSAAALRYSHVFDDDKGGGGEGIAGGQKLILVLLPSDLKKAVDLLAILYEASPKLNTDLGISIKPHPDYNAEKIISKFDRRRWPEEFKIYDGDIGNALASASVVISSASSSMIEAAIKGIPVIYIGGQTTVNFNILSGVNLPFVAECFTAKELASALDRYSVISVAEKMRYKEMGARLRDKLFTPLSEETLAPFLDISIADKGKRSILMGLDRTDENKKDFIDSSTGLYI